MYNASTAANSGTSSGAQSSSLVQLHQMIQHMSSRPDDLYPRGHMACAIINDGHAYLGLLRADDWSALQPTINPAEKLALTLSYGTASLGTDENMNLLVAETDRTLWHPHDDRPESIHSASLFRLNRAGELEQLLTRPVIVLTDPDEFPPAPRAQETAGAAGKVLRMLKKLLTDFPPEDDTFPRPQCCGLMVVDEKEVHIGLVEDFHWPEVAPALDAERVLTMFFDDCFGAELGVRGRGVLVSVGCERIAVLPDSLDLARLRTISIYRQTGPARELVRVLQKPLKALPMPSEVMN